jgi:hypothetical protein
LELHVCVSAGFHDESAAPDEPIDVGALLALNFSVTDEIETAGSIK